MFCISNNYVKIKRQKDRKHLIILIQFEFNPLLSSSLKGLPLHVRCTWSDVRHHFTLRQCKVNLYWGSVQWTCTEAVQVDSVPLHLVALCSPSKDHISPSSDINMSDDNGITHHAQRDDSYSFLSDIERSAVERMGSTVGKDAIMAILSGLDRDAPY